MEQELYGPIYEAPIVDLVIQDGWLSLYIGNILEFDLSWLGALLIAGIAMVVYWVKRRRKRK
jgi:hypothetical protein